MALLTVAVIVLAAATLLNLAVLAAVVRRMTRLTAPAGPAADHGLPAGAPVPDYTVESADGTRLTREALLGRTTLFAFYSSSCPDCRTQAPELAARSAALAAEGVAVVPVLLGPDTPDGLSSVLEGVGQLMNESGPGGLTELFRVQGTPSYFLVGPQGSVLRNGSSLGECLQAHAV
ncbi:redoxin domain-containing protein [Streptomyces sp. A1277]|uniref:TlpA family protein disulfide reductase n=1 Tax=Streptomyces sp. A1277 TaxID=2563103 RepID=UPI001444B4C3|nr:redoxin domain-containing protein [Streptomyces sp. A1277]